MFSLQGEIMKKRITIFTSVVALVVCVTGFCGVAVANSFSQDAIPVHTQEQQTALDSDPKTYEWPSGTEERSYPVAQTFSYSFSEVAGDESVSHAWFFLTSDVDMGNVQQQTKRFEAKIDGNTVSYETTTLGVGKSYSYFFQAQTNFKKIYNSPKEEFRTEEAAPANKKVDGISNVRDIGGWKTPDGVIKQGLIYRTSALDIDCGQRIVSEEGRKTLLNDFGVKTEIDLRYDGDGDYAEDMLGDAVTYNNYKINYHNIGNFLTDTDIQNVFLKVFNDFADESNYPMFYHCNIGTDRTGIVAFLLGGYLGMSEDDLLRDYGFSNFGNIKGHRNVSTILGYMDNLESKYQTKSVQKNIHMYLNEIGITDDTLNHIKSNLISKTSDSLSVSVKTTGDNIPAGTTNWRYSLYSGADVMGSPISTRIIQTSGAMQSQTVSFDSFNLSHEGVFLYTIKQDDVAGWSTNVQTKVVYIKVDRDGDKLIASGPYSDNTCSQLIELNYENVYDNNFAVRIHSDQQRAALENLDSIGYPIPELFETNYGGYLDLSKPNSYNVNYAFDENILNANLVLQLGDGFYTPTPAASTYAATTNNNIASYNFGTLEVGKKYIYHFEATAQDGQQFVSPNMTFYIENNAPANKIVEDFVNVRDVGGWNTADGHKIKQGLLYRTSALNNSGELSQKTIDTMLGDFGVKTEIDLRNDGRKSKLSELLNYCLVPMDYHNLSHFIDDVDLSKAIGDAFTILSDSNNYPLFYHCSIGTDRTGIISFLLGGLLGVDTLDLERDYMLSNLARISGTRGVSTITNYIVSLEDHYHKGDLQQNIIAYLTDNAQGKPSLTQDQISSLFTNLLEPKSATVSFGITKTLQGEVSSDHAFTYNLFEGDNLLDSITLIANEDNNPATANFHSRTFTEAGVYPFTIKEQCQDEWTSDFKDTIIFMKAVDQAGQLVVSGPYLDQECTVLIEGGQLMTTSFDNPPLPENSSSASTADLNYVYVLLILLFLAIAGRFLWQTMDEAL